jgi:heme-degrading monooxygenase HmoA
MTDRKPKSGAPLQAIMVDVWSVPDGNQQAVADAVDELFGHLVRLPGFLEGELLMSADPMQMLAYARFDSVAAQQRARDEPATQAIIRRLRGVAHQNLGRYTVAKSFLPPQ